MDRPSYRQAAVALFDSLDTDSAGVLYLDDLRNIMTRVSTRFKTIVEGVLHSHIFEKRSFIMTKQEFLDQYAETMTQWHPRKSCDKENIRIINVKPVIVEHCQATAEAISAFKLLQPQQSKPKLLFNREGRRGRSTQPGVRNLIERRSSNDSRPSSRGSSARARPSVDCSQLDISVKTVESNQSNSRPTSSCSFRGSPVVGKFKQLYSNDMQRLMQVRHAHLKISR